MKATNCGRYTFELGGEKLNYSALRRYVCNQCGGAVTHSFLGGVDRVACARCGNDDIISESKYLQRRSDSMEARYSLPPKVRTFYEQKGQSMPLKDVQGLGDLTKLGNIRLGWTEPTQSGYDIPVASDYFVLTDAPFLAGVLGEKPTALEIHFPYPSFDDNISADYRVWAGGARKGSGISVCQGDGEFVSSALPFKVSTDSKGRVHVNRAPGDRLVSYGKAAIDFQWGEHSFTERDVVPCPGAAKGLYPHCEACDPGILLKVMIRKPVEAARWGYWQIATRSIRNYKHFMGVWASITNGGRVPIPMNDVPFVLRIMPGSTLFQNQKDKTWGAREAFFLKLELDQKVAELVEGARERRFVAMLEGRVDPMLIPQLSAELERGFEELPFDDPPIEDADYDEDLGDDPFLREGDYHGAPMDVDAYEDLKEEREREAKIDLDYVPDWIDTDEKGLFEKLCFEAQEHLGYEHYNHVKNAVAQLVPYRKERSKLTYRATWHLLQEHQRSKEADTAQ